MAAEQCDVGQCPVTGDRCTGKGCKPDAPLCATEADRILWLEPDRFEAEINATADRLGIERKLYAQFVYDKAFGSGASGTLNTESDDNPFLGL